MPAIWRAEARLVIEAAQIPGELAASTVQAGPVEILAVIRGQILTRENLLQIASRFAVYADAADLPDDQKAADMVERIVMDLPPSVTPGTSPFVQVSFDAPDPEMSAAVTNLLVDQILEQNTRLRNTVAAQTLEFFQSEVKRLDGELAAQGDKILQFQEAHKDALPTSLDYQRSRQTTLQERLSQQERELSSLRDRRARMVEIFERTGRTDILGENVSPEQRRLQQLKDELASALVIYSPDNPRVIALKARVAALEAANIRAGLGTQDTPNMSVFEFQLADIDGQIAFLIEQIGDIETEQDEVKVNIEATPGNAIRLGSLERDYENIRQQYSQATAALAEARTGAQIEAQSRGARVTVTERAVVPSKPAEPNRKLIAAAGLGAGLGAGLALFLILEFLNRSVRRASELGDRLGITPFGTVPYIATDRERRGRRWRVFAAVLGVPLLLGLAGWQLYERVPAARALFDEMIGLEPLPGALPGAAPGAGPDAAQPAPQTVPQEG
ncbi:MAG: lipopolysaccharide biosynthesis protein [Paracoccaceae bacterium]